MLTRRALFLKTAQLASVGLIVSSLPTKLIAETLAIARDDYDIALEMARQVIADNKDRALIVREQRVTEIYARADDLFGFATDKFPPPLPLTGEAIAEVQRLFSGEIVKGACWKEPRIVFGAVFAIAVARELLVTHRCAVNFALPGFTRFADSYRKLVIA